MKWIVITTPEFIDNEANYINQLFEQGIDLLHLRKPDAPKEDCERLIKEIDERWRGRIVIHEHFELCEKYHLYGIHLNRRNHETPKGFKGNISRSCHCFEELKDIEAYDHVFLSPIFDSISKVGYNHSFTNKQLEDAANSSLINEKVIALGGVIPAFIPQLRAWNFGGAAFLGDVWNKVNTSEWTNYLESTRKRLAPTSAKNTLSGSKVW